MFHHAILNLPDSALTFLDVFRGVDWRARGFEAPPTVHVYCFSRAADPKKASYLSPSLFYNSAPLLGDSALGNRPESILRPFFLQLPSSFWDEAFSLLDVKV